jgi:hypothetical protein
MKYPSTATLADCFVQLEKVHRGIVERGQHCREADALARPELRQVMVEFGLLFLLRLDH